MGHGSAVENVGHLGAGHGAAPAVGQTDAQRLTDQILGIGGVAHVGHVHGSDDLAVDGTRRDALLHPDLLALFGGALGPQLIALGFAVLVDTGAAHVMGDVVDVAAFGLNAPFLSQLDQLGGIGDMIVTVGAGVDELPRALTAVVGVGGAAAGGHAEVVAAGDRVGVGTADALGGLGSDAAGAHGADAAADALLTESAVRGLILDAVLPYVDADLFGCLFQTGRVGLHLFDSGQSEFQAHSFKSSFRCS